MPSMNSGLSARSLAELALVISRVGSSILDESATPSHDSLKTFWQSSRSLEQGWMRYLDEWTASGNFDVERLERQRGSQDLTFLARNTVSGLLQIRNGILSRLLLVPESDQNRVLEVDKLRRRSDRWTDFLIGPLAVKYGCFEFAFDPDRARDFGDEATIADPMIGPNAVEHLVSAGMRMKFLQYLPDESVTESEFMGLTQSILSCIPATALHRDGSLRTVLEQRIMASSMRQERRAVFTSSVADGFRSFPAIHRISTSDHAEE